MTWTQENIEQVLDLLASMVGTDEGEPTVEDLLAWSANGRAVSAGADYIAATLAADYEDTPQTATALARVAAALIPPAETGAGS